MTVETTLLIVAAVGAMVLMTIYFQRAYQGQLYSATSGQGAQFDPTKTYGVHRTLLLNQTQHIDIKAGPIADVTTGIADLPSIPGGETSRISVQTVNVDSNWTMVGSANYGAGN